MVVRDCPKIRDTPRIVARLGGGVSLKSPHPNPIPEGEGADKDIGE